MSITRPGTYVVQSKLNGGAVAGIVIALLVFIALVAVAVWFIWKKNAGTTMKLTTAKMAATSGGGVKTEVPLAKI